ncbi:hypothetical protein FCV25MIE_26936 [Fagus crenata]
MEGTDAMAIWTDTELGGTQLSFRQRVCLRVETKRKSFGFVDWRLGFGASRCMVLSFPEDGILDDERGPHKNSGYKKHYT